MAQTYTPITEEEKELVYEHLPSLIIDRVEPQVLAEKLEIPTQHVVDIYRDFLAGGDPEKLTEVIAKLSHHVKAVFLVQTFKHTRRMADLTESSIGSAEKLDSLLKSKIKQAKDLVDSDDGGPDAISLKDLERLYALGKKQVDLVRDIIKDSPLAKQVEMAPSVIINNNTSPPPQSELPEAKNVTPEYTGYTSPPNIEDAEISNK